MFTLDEARRIAAAWVDRGRPDGARWQARVHEFELGYVIWAVPADGDRREVGAGRGVVDRMTGELSLWPSLPVSSIVEMFRAERAREIPAPRTWDPATQARRDLARAGFPEHVTHLTLADGRAQISRSTKGDGELNLHPLVAAALAELPPGSRERAAERCSEVAAFSDVLHRADTQRQADRRPTLSLDEVRATLFRGAEIVTYRVCEPGDELGGRTVPPCLACQYLLGWFGFEMAGGRR
ncbi:hypothetical protein Athai_07710 [Actinocatenispora thailandica]|uniref:YwqJ-like deaminase n=1 Tax=Actinocatenispora thailandica TaxID=227318 RepID=A0A7R7DKI2_9ACTN|nr:YwqJ-related putative deaminase [Actinocatenispora thailandica]BCJ33268.1 hypothetical protein Athai_07710 [Actinocatenispora thailandica]